MSVARVLEYYDRVVDAPDAVEKLRRFVLELAVRGRLVEQADDDAPAVVFDSTLSVDAQMPFEIPSTWQWSRLAALGSLKGGGTPSKARPEYWNGAIPWVSPKDMKLDYIERSQLMISDAAIRGSAVQMIGSGSILFVVRGMILAHSFPVALTRCAVTINQDMKALVLHRPEMGEYFLRALKGLRTVVLGRVQRSSHGTGRLEGTDYQTLLVPVPPLAEQHRVVAKVDELMVLCDQLEAARTEREATRDRFTVATLGSLTAADVGPTEFREKAQFALNSLAPLTSRVKQVRQLRQTIIDLAVRGKLAPQKVNDAPVATLLASIAQERLRFAKLSGKKPMGRVGTVDASEMPFALPHSWEWAYFGDLLLEDSQNGYSRSPDGAADGIPILRISAGTIRQDGIVAEEEHKLISGVSPAHRASFSLKSGDLLACRFNGNRRFVGRLSLFEDYLKLSPIYPDKLIRLRLPKQYVCPPLVRMFADSDAGRTEIENFCATTVGNWGISASNLKRVRIPLPPIAEQRRIVAKVDELMAICDQLQMSIESQEQDRSRLLDAALAEALQLH